jgi:hypothetical protein
MTISKGAFENTMFQGKNIIKIKSITTFKLILSVKISSLLFLDRGQGWACKEKSVSKQ